ncbi:MAG: hypothetical protein ACRBDX_07870 [Gammaproteobacteria bacterium]
MDGRSAENAGAIFCPPWTMYMDAQVSRKTGCRERPAEAQCIIFNHW